MWADAEQSELVQHPSADDGIYNPIWFDGPQLADALVPDDNEAASSEENDDFLEAASSDEEGDASDNKDDSGEGQ